MLSLLQAHGLDAGPTQRPLLAGTLASLVADIPAMAVLVSFGSLDALAQAAGSSRIIAGLAYGAMMLIGGLFYGWLFQRAANDLRGGWLFGLSFGFVLWMLGPVPLLQWLPEQPVLSGYPAAGVLIGELFWGLVLGMAFPLVHRLLHTRLIEGDLPPSDRTGPHAAANIHLLRHHHKR